MTAPLVQRLSLVVDAATGQTETRMDAVAASSRDMGEAVERSASQVAAAAERVALAQLKRDNAADRVALAERRLQEVQERSAAGSSQVLAAEQRLEAARRNLHVATRAVESAEQDQVQVQGRAVESTARLATEQERARGTTDRFGGQLAGLTELAKGYAAFQLGDAVRESVSGFLEGARGAATLAASMNATVEQGGQLSTLFSSMGLEASDLLEIQAEFATKIGTNGAELRKFGAEVKTNNDGTTNWALTLTDALTQLQKIPDATQRNATGFRLFGEEGYKQLSRLLSSGVSVEDALARIGTPFDEGDVQNAREFDSAMAQLSITGTQLGQGLGSTLVPVITGVAEGLNQVADVAGQVPAPLGLAAAAAVLWGAAQRGAATEGSFLSNALDNSRERISTYRSAVEDATTGSGRLASGMGVARVAGGGLLSALGGPLGVAVLGLGAGFTLLNSLTGRNSEEAEAAASANTDLAGALQKSSGVITESVRQQAALSAQEAGLLDVGKRLGVGQGDVTRALLEGGDAYDQVVDKVNAYIDASLTAEHAGDPEWTKNADDARDFLTQLDGLRDTTDENTTAQQELAGELQQTADKQALATAATDTLNQALQNGNVSTAELTRLAHDAAVAQDVAAAADNRAQAAVDAYRDSTILASAATLELITARYSSENAGFAFLQAMDAARTATDDATTSVDEQRQAQVALMQAALSAAGAAADAAVQNAEATGQVVDDVTEAHIRADAMLQDLRARLDTPGLTKGARDEMQGLIDQLQTAKDKGDITAVLSLTGADDVAGELDDTTEDRDTTVAVETRGGPAVIAYLDSITTRERTALIRVESRNGPAVDDYVGGLAHERLALIRVETRGGPDVDRYLDSLAATRTATIQVQTKQTGAGGRGGTGAGEAAGLFGGALGAGPVTVQVYPQVDSGGRLTTAAATVTGRQVVSALRDYERSNGAGWRRG